MMNFVPAQNQNLTIPREAFFGTHLYEDYGSENVSSASLVKYTDRGFTLDRTSKDISGYIKRIKFRNKVQIYTQKRGIYTTVKKCGSWILPPFRTDKKSGQMLPTPFTGYVDIHAYNKKDDNNMDTVKYGYYGLEQCGNAHFCPVCASKLLAFRRAEIAHISKKMLEAGFQVLFLTHTAPHSAKTDPVSFVKKFNEAERKKKIGKAWEELKKKYGLSHYIRACEATVDNPHYKGKKKRNGLHWHSHTILFFQKEKPFSEVEAQEFEKWLSEKWYKCLLKQELVSESDKDNVIAKGTDIQRPWTRDDGELEDAEKISRLADYICKSLSFELASHNTKEGKKDHRMSHFEFLRQVVFGEIEDKKDILPKLFEAFFRRAKLYFSFGLKKFCDVEEINDDDILHGKRSVEIYSHHPKDEKWLEIVDKGRQGHVIEALNQTKDLDEAVDVVADYFETVASGYNPLTLEALRE